MVDKKVVRKAFVEWALSQVLVNWDVRPIKSTRKYFSRISRKSWEYLEIDFT